MTAQFGGWPPAPIGCKVAGRCIVAGDGTLTYSSKYADGTPVFASSKTATGAYRLVLGKVPATSAQLSVTMIQAPLALKAFGESAIQTPAGTFDVVSYDAAGAAVDSAFSAVLFDA